jgi:hypothetical protein
MIDPSWLAGTLAGLVLATALYCVGRIAVSLLAGRRIELDADLTHILMGIGMAGMFVTRLAILDSTVWAVVFGLVTAWYAARVILEGARSGSRRTGLRHHAGHTVSALAMLYMFLAIPTSAATASSSTGGSSMGMGGGSGMGAHLPTLALLFALALFAYAVLVADRIPLTTSFVAATPVGEPGAAATTAGRGSGLSAWGCGFGIGRGTLLAPRGSALREIVMSVAMGVMLIAML